MSRPEPFCRAVVRDGAITLHEWSPLLIRNGPRAVALASVDAVLCDFTRVDEGELEVSLITPERLGPGAREAILRWTEDVGYRRLWLPDEVLELPGTPALGEAHVRCPCCAADWRDRGIAFWEYVRERGSFPLRCLACGGALPQWTVDACQTPAQRVTRVRGAVREP